MLSVDENSIGELIAHLCILVNLNRIIFIEKMRCILNYPPTFIFLGEGEYVESDEFNGFSLTQVKKYIFRT